MKREQEARNEAEQGREELERVSESRMRLMRGFSHTPRTHSLAQAGAYPDLPVVRLSNRRGYTSSQPRKSERNRAIFASADDV